MPELPLSKLFVLLVLVTGPLRVVPAFASLTRTLGAPGAQGLGHHGPKL